MGVASGARNIAHYNSEGILIRDVSDELYKVNRDATPFQTFMRVLARKKEAKSTKIEWQKDSLLPIADAINNGAGYALGTETSLVVDNGTYFKAGNVVVIPRTGEQMLVTAVATNTLTVVRGWGTTAGAAILDNDPVLILSHASAESAGVPGIKTMEQVNDYNFHQIIKTPYGASATARAVAASGGTYGGDNFLQQKKNKAIEHLRSIELQTLFGLRNEDTSTFSDPARSMGGLRQFLTQNVKAVRGALTESVFKAWLRDIFREGRGSPQRILLCAPLIAEGISFWAQGKVMTQVDDKKYGMAVTNYFSNFGELVIKPHWLFSTGVYAGYAFAVDPAFVRYTYLRERDTHVQYDVQATGYDQKVDQYLTECSLEVAVPEVHGVMTGVTSYS